MLSLMMPLLLAAAPPVSTEADIRCLVIFAKVGVLNTDAKAKRMSSLAVAYFIGKLRATDPDYPLEANRRRVLADPAILEATEESRCAIEVAAFGKELVKVVGALQDP